jgi:hypothetical protein
MTPEPRQDSHHSLITIALCWSIAIEKYKLYLSFLPLFKKGGCRSEEVRLYPTPLHIP